MDDLIARLRAVESGGPDFIGDIDEGRCVTCWRRNPDGPEAADRIEKLEAENARLQGLLTNVRARSKARGGDLLREEADATLAAFRNEWEPLRDVAVRAGAQSAAWLVSRARDLQRRGLVESRWFGGERTSFKVWRVTVRATLSDNRGVTK